MGGLGQRSDILGIEFGRSIVRGVRVDGATLTLTALAERPVDPVSMIDDVIDPGSAALLLEDVLFRLGVDDPTRVRVGATIGPRNAGVGSGPTMATWLADQAIRLREPMFCAGRLGVAFAPIRAVEAAADAGRKAGVELERVDLAPVAAARCLEAVEDDTFTLGSGRGWRARLRDHEVLEAMESLEVGQDEPMWILRSSGPGAAISGFRSIALGRSLNDSSRVDLGQLAPAVGAAIGVVEQSPANLLAGDTVPSFAPPPVQEPARVSGGAVIGDDAEATLQLGRVANADLRAHVDVVRPAADAYDPMPEPEPGPTGPLAAGGAVMEPVVTPEPGPVEPHARSWSDSVDEADPITMFSPETDADEMLGKRDRRVDPNLVLAVLALLAVVLFLAYLLL